MKGVDDVDGIGEENAQALLAGRVTERGGDMNDAERVAAGLLSPDDIELEI